MNRRIVVYLIGAAIVFGLGAAWDHYLLPAPAHAQNQETPQAQDNQEGEEGRGPTNALPFGTENPVVAACPHTYTTDYEEDPFNPDRVRRTRTKVNRIAIVHADGTVETKAVQ